VGVEQEASGGQNPVAALYRYALPQVYGYLLPRCGSAALAEDLTAETFMAAVAAARREYPPELTVAWLVGVARHKLIDHWRRAERERRSLAVIDHGTEPVDDPKQILVEDPAGNPVELFEPILPEARLSRPATSSGRPDR
jgi:DNA-directed RNA polymerase specialized sigma24 family protein